MYVRTWKDSDMVATSDSNPSGSASNDEPDATPAADGSVDTDSSAQADAPAEPEAAPTSEASPSTPPPATAPSSTESTRPAEPATSSRNRSRRARPAVSRDQVMGAVNGVRERLAAIVWIVAVVFAVILIAGALLIALEANPNNELVEQVKDWANDLDGPFSNLFTFDGDNAVKKAALTNWGLAAVAWLVGGKIVSSVIRP